MLLLFDVFLGYCSVILSVLSFNKGCFLYLSDSMSSRGTSVTRRLGSAQSSLLVLLEGLGFLDADSLLRLPTIGVSARERRDNLS